MVMLTWFDPWLIVCLVIIVMSASWPKWIFMMMNVADMIENGRPLGNNKFVFARGCRNDAVSEMIGCRFYPWTDHSTVFKLSSGLQFFCYTCETETCLIYGVKNIVINSTVLFYQKKLLFHTMACFHIEVPISM